MTNPDDTSDHNIVYRIDRHGFNYSITIRLHIEYFFNQNR